MNKETEIKLRASRETLAALRDHPLLKKRNKSGWERRELFNQYFDTPDRDLARARVALRLRRDGEQFIQTLKTRGQSVAGLSERNEWDWYLDKARLDPKKLTDDCWPASLAELDKKQLKPIFTTDFHRERAEIAWGRGKAKVVIEAALDQGKVIARVPMPLYGLLSEKPVDRLAEDISSAIAALRGLGCSLQSPFHTLAFAGLPVSIGRLKISSVGLIDVWRGEVVPLLAA